MTNFKGLKKQIKNELGAHEVDAIVGFVSHPLGTLTAKVSDLAQSVGQIAHSLVDNLGHDLGQVFTAEGDYTKSSGPDEKVLKKE